MVEDYSFALEIQTLTTTRASGSIWQRKCRTHTTCLRCVWAASVWAGWNSPRWVPCDEPLKWAWWGPPCRDQLTTSPAPLSLPPPPSFPSIGHNAPPSQSPEQQPVSQHSDVHDLYSQILLENSIENLENHSLARVPVTVVRTPAPCPWFFPREIWILWEYTNSFP